MHFSGVFWSGLFSLADRSQSSERRGGCSLFGSSRAERPGDFRGSRRAIGLVEGGERDPHCRLLEGDMSSGWSRVLLVFAASEYVARRGEGKYFSDGRDNVCIPVIS